MVSIRPLKVFFNVMTVVGFCGCMIICLTLREEIGWLPIKLQYMVQIGKTNLVVASVIFFSLTLGPVTMVFVLSSPYYNGLQIVRNQLKYEICLAAGKGNCRAKLLSALSGTENSTKAPATSVESKIKSLTIVHGSEDDVNWSDFPPPPGSSQGEKLPPDPGSRSFLFLPEDDVQEEVPADPPTEVVVEQPLTIQDEKLCVKDSFITTNRLQIPTEAWGGTSCDSFVQLFEKNPCQAISMDHSKSKWYNQLKNGKINALL